MAPSSICGRVEDQLSGQYLLGYRDLERPEDLPLLPVDLTDYPDLVYTIPLNIAWLMR